MSSTSGNLPLVVALAAIVLAVVALYPALAPAGPVTAPTSRTFYISAMEPKGTTNLAKEPFPAEPLPVGDGYELKGPKENGDWVVETYRFVPSEITVYQGDTVTLEILGVNGKEHFIYLENYAENEFTLNRGYIRKITFTADEVGIFDLVCNNHVPSMRGHITVLPRP